MCENEDVSYGASLQNVTRELTRECTVHSFSLPPNDGDKVQEL
jgi:hypothetical protein